MRYESCIIFLCVENMKTSSRLLKKTLLPKNTSAIRDIGLHLKKATALHSKERKQLFFVCALEHTNKILEYLGMI